MTQARRRRGHDGGCGLLRDGQHGPRPRRTTAENAHLAAPDIGNVAVWLSSDASDYINGQTIFVCGGMTLYPEFADGG